MRQAAMKPTAQATDDGRVHVSVPADGILTIPEAALLQHKLMEAASKALREFPNGHEGERAGA